MLLKTSKVCEHLFINYIVFVAATIPKSALCTNIGTTDQDRWGILFYVRRGTPLHARMMPVALAPDLNNCSRFSRTSLRKILERMFKENRTEKSSKNLFK
jgi:hypothetical protein